MINETELATPSSETDRELIRLCLKGDKVAQYRLYKNYSRAMYNLCIRMVPDISEAEDLLQESFVKMFRELPSYRGQSTFGAWLKRIVINQCLNHLRRSRPIYVDLENVDLFDAEEKEFLFGEITAEEIHHSIKRLPEGARVVCVLHLIEGYKHSDIAQMTGISESTSKSQYRRAVSLLQQDLTRKSNAGEI